MASATRNASVAHSASRSWNSRSSEASPPTTISVQLAASASIAFPLCQTPPTANWFTSFIGTFDADACNVNLKAAQRKRLRGDPRIFKTGRIPGLRSTLKRQEEFWRTHTLVCRDTTLVRLALIYAFSLG